MGAAHGMKVSADAVAASSDSARGIAEGARGKARFVLDVQTAGWSFGYFPTNWGKYRVTYAVRAKLIDVDRGDVLAEAFCSRFPELDATAPSHDELLANEAARLKQELAAAASECAGRFKREMLSL